ncbi:MAG: radical SAM protein [Desulfurococcaceae archaeon]
MKFFMPRKKYVPISITGSWCALNCKFCKGKYLKHMIHVTPETARHVLRELYSAGARGVLVSGGFRPDGSLPVEPYVEVLREVKKELGLVMSAHLGLVKSRELLSELKGVIDVVDYEFTLSSFIASEVRGLKPSDYTKSLELLVESGLRVVPHIFAWHPEQTASALKSELRVVEDYGLNEATLLIYIDPLGITNPDALSKKVIELIEAARSYYSGRLYLGCMRPPAIKRFVDPVVVEKGLVERVANPYYKLLKPGEAAVYDACCSLPDELLSEFVSEPSSEQ